MKEQTVGKKRKRRAIRPTDLPVLVFHRQNCISGLKGKSCRYCFRMKSRAGLAWTPIGNSKYATLAKKYKLRNPKWGKMDAPKGQDKKKFKIITFEQGVGNTWIHFTQVRVPKEN